MLEYQLLTTKDGERAWIDPTQVRSIIGLGQRTKLILDGGHAVTVNGTDYDVRVKLATGDFPAPGHEVHPAGVSNAMEWTGGTTPPLSPEALTYWEITVGGGYGVFYFVGTESEAEEARRDKARWEAAPATKKALRPATHEEKDGHQHNIKPLSDDDTRS